jgi:hypothetical protein
MHFNTKNTLKNNHNQILKSKQAGYPHELHCRKTSNKANLKVATNNGTLEVWHEISLLF